MSVLFQAAFAASVTVGPGDDLQALSSSLGPGDTMTFQDGVYELENQLSITALGEDGAPVQIVAASGATPILKAIGTNSVFELRDAAFVTLRGLTFEGPDELWLTEGGRGVTIRNSTDVVFEENEVRNHRQTLLAIEGDTARITVRRNHLHHSSDGHGIYVGCGDGSCWLAEGVIAENHIHDLTSEGLRYGIVLDNGSQGNRIADNVIHTTGHGIRVESTQLGDPNEVEGNAIFDGLGDGMQITGGSRVRNNVVFQMTGFGIFSGNHENDDLGDVVISYNTVALTDSWAVRLEDWANRDGMVFSSNAIANITGRGLDYESEGEPDATNYVTRNVVSGLVDGIDITLYPDWFVPGAGTADFSDVEAWDFYPVNGSELVGFGDPAGDAWIPEVDFNGAQRNGANPTAGAYEFDGGAGNPGWLLDMDFKELDTVDGPGRTDLDQGGCCKGKSEPEEAMLLLPLLAFGLRRRRSGATPVT